MPMTFEMFEKIFIAIPAAEQEALKALLARIRDGVAAIDAKGGRA
jgi:hypothetical protein